MEDAGGKRSEKVKLQLKKNILTEDQISISVDKDWLTAPDRAYPVKIDPTVSIAAGDILDNSVEQGSPDLNTDNAYSYIGYDDGITSGNLQLFNTAHLRTRTFLKFNLPPIGSDQSVTAANLNLYKFTSWSSAARAVELQPG